MFILNIRKFYKLVLLLVIPLLTTIILDFYNVQYKVDKVIEIYPNNGPTKIKFTSLQYDNDRTECSSHSKITLFEEPETPLILTKLDDDNLTSNDIFNNLESKNTKTISTPLRNPLLDNQMQENLGAQNRNSIDIHKDIHEDSNAKSKQQLVAATEFQKRLNVTTVNIKSHNTSNNPSRTSYKTHGYCLQLGSYKNESDALNEWLKIQEKYKNILGNGNVIFKKMIHDNGKIFYLLQVCNYKSLSKAKSDCKRLASRQQPCTIVK